MKNKKMWGQSKNDVESGTSEPLYPMMSEAPELRWAFIRKVYSVVAIQLLLTAVVAAVVVSFRPISTFFSTTYAGLFVYILIILTAFVGTGVFVYIIVFIYMLLHKWKQFSNNYSVHGSCITFVCVVCIIIDAFVILFLFLFF